MLLSIANKCYDKQGLNSTRPNAAQLSVVVIFVKLFLAYFETVEEDLNRGRPQMLFPH